MEKSVTTLKEKIKHLTPDMSEDKAKQPTGRSSPPLERPDMSDMGTKQKVPTRIVLVGKTGAGKSSSGNTILGRKAFRAAKSSSSITKECCKEVGEVAGRKLVVVDTPGLFDPTLSDEELTQKIGKCINMTAPGLHAIVVVIKVGPFTEEERLSVEKVRAMFGEEADRYTMVLFTHGDELDSYIEKYLSEAPQDLKEFLKLCGGHHHIFNNKDTHNRTQVLDFLEKVDKMMSGNESEYYTCPMFQDVEKMLQSKEEELKHMYQKKEEELVHKFNKDREMLLDTIKSLKESEQAKEKVKLLEKKNMELMEYKRYYEEKQRAIRDEIEQTPMNEKIMMEICIRLKKFYV